MPTEEPDARTLRDEPVPLHVVISVAVLRSPRLASILLGIPFGIAFYLLTSLNLLPAFLPTYGIPVIDAAAGWAAGTIVLWLHLSKPY